MNYVSYEERAKRTERDNDGFVLWPVYTGIGPGEVVDTGYSGERIAAPENPGLYELWHVVKDGLHVYWQWRKIKLNKKREE